MKSSIPCIFSKDEERQSLTLCFTKLLDTFADLGSSGSQEETGEEGRNETVSVYHFGKRSNADQDGIIKATKRSGNRAWG